MRLGKSHPDWTETVEGWKRTQADLRARAVIAPLSPIPRFVLGADCAFSKDDKTVLAAVVVYDRHEKTVVEIQHATAPITVPYIPTFLSFREGQALLLAIGKVKHEYGVICFDGAGVAHPRRCGLATHLGVTLDVPSIGVAKSRLIGTYDEPEIPAGSTSPLMDKGEQIGLVLRARNGVRPLFVSTGHRVDLASAVKLLMSCAKHRIPEPTRLADIEVAKLKRSLMLTSAH